MRPKGAKEACMSKFQPNAMTFDQGLERIRAALANTGYSGRGAIVTSKDKAMREATRLLKVDNVPEGFTKYQLPVYMDGPTQLFISVGAPGVEVPEHSHDEGDGFRYIVSGSIVYNGQELTAGDWMFIPKGQKYSITIGDLGSIQCYCYQCCCA